MKDEEYELEVMNAPSNRNTTKVNIITKLKNLFIPKKIVESFRIIQINNTPTNHNEKPQETKKEFLSNKIATAKYTWYSCLPKFLTEQFSNYANIFFLMISILQQIGNLSPTSKYNTIVPLIVVLICTAFKEFIEDIKRHKSDNETNNKSVKVLSKEHGFVTRKWIDLKVGDIIRIDNGEDFPADLLLISSSEPEGVCYIETSNLDGETNLKVKQSCTETNEIITPELANGLTGYIKSEGPNDSLYTYTGTLYMENQSSVSVSPNQILLRGAMLRNTNWVYCIVVFTGHDTKLMRNASSAPIKKTNIVKKTNTQILFLFLILLGLSVLCASGSLYFQNHNSRFLKFVKSDMRDSGFKTWVKNFFTFIILFNNLIPISLIVTMEVVKFQQAELINSDLDMYYEESDTPALCRTSSLVEELGQIGYIFSDKTGTLTCNKMDFKECTIQGVQYTEDEGTRNKLSFKKLTEKASEEIEGELNYVSEFLTLLSTCHTVIPEVNGASIVYQASSPDEGALVKGASDLGYKFFMRKPRSVMIKISEVQEEEWQILNICEFNSTRKRMTTILRSPNGEIKLFCKGADNVILERLGEDKRFVDETLIYLEEYACVGLRTLCLAYRIISEKEYLEWSQKFQEANTSLEDRQNKLDEVAELIEKDLILLGATAIEDKLQDGVPETIFTLGQAGIKIWVLTGDKQETAINIAYSCKLIQPHMTVWVFNKNDELGCTQFLSEKQSLIDQMDNKKDEVVLIVDGKTLEFCLSTNLDLPLFNLASKCKSVICCRVSPLQKALVVKMVKKRTTSILLAIGDGANDVSMIQAAHVGVGINGQEGLQAARSSDFAISQFRFLKKLLLIHGAWSYNRLSKLILYSFYKNITLYMTQFWYSFVNGFSGQTLYESWTNTFYNILFTMMPPLVIGIFDQHLSARMLDRYPELYKAGQNNLLFNIKTFWGTTLNALYHSILIFTCICLVYRNDILLDDGTTGNYGHFSITMYSCVLVTVLLKALLITSHWTKYTLLAIPGSLAIWFVFIPVYTSMSAYFGFAYEYAGMLSPLFGNGVFWLVLIIVPVICLLRDYSWKFYSRLCSPQSYHVVQEIQKYNIPDYRPTRERFRMAVRKVVNIQRLKKDRGYAFSQNEMGLANLMSFYDTTKPKPVG